MRLAKLSMLAVLVVQMNSVSAAAYLDRDIEIVDPIQSAETIVVNEEEGAEWNSTIQGRIFNSLNKPVPRAAIVYGGVEYFADDNGEFSISKVSGNSNLLVKKAGYRRVSVAPTSSALSINLEPVDVKSTYMQVHQLKAGMKSPVYAGQMNLLQTTELNAITIDYKDDNGRIADGLKPHLDILRAKGVYLIARVVAFKDRLGSDPKIKKERMLINKNTGGLWLDKHKVAYLNPYSQDAHDYLISVAKQAVIDGFDEVQFDYVRFPTDGDRSALKLPAVHTSETRSAAISEFLKQARKAVGALGAFLAADVFGDTAFVSGDSGIGQNIEAISAHLDYVCPMVYPSGYNKGYAGVKDPVAQPKDIVAVSVKRYRLRSEKVNKDLVIRPWLQSFRDYSGSGRAYGAWEISQQIEGSESQGGQGFLLWNASGKFSSAGLKPKNKSAKGPM